MAMAAQTQNNHHHSHDASSHCAGFGQLPTAAPTDSGESLSPCQNHSALCCTACAPYCDTALLIPLQFSPMAVERYQQFVVPLRVIVLSRDIRPPIV
jgi:hypothetical protein